MRAAELGLLYLVVGAGCALWRFRVRRDSALRDVPRMVTPWPVFLPFALAETAAAHAPDESTRSLLAALHALADGPLATLLPGPLTVETIVARIRTALERVARIDTLLASPDLDETRLTARLAAFKSAGDETSAAAVAGRLAAVARLKTLRDRSEREVVQVRELLSRLAEQAELLKLSGGDSSAVRGSVRELVARSEVLASVLGSGELEGAVPEARV